MNQNDICTNPQKETVTAYGPVYLFPAKMLGKDPIWAKEVYRKKFSERKKVQMRGHFSGRILWY